MSTTLPADLLNVEGVPDGLLVQFRPGQLPDTNARDLTDGLFDLAQQRSGPRLYLDLGAEDRLGGDLPLRLVVLGRKLQDLGDQLVLCGVRPGAYEALQATGLTDFLDVRPGLPAGAGGGRRHEAR